MTKATWPGGRSCGRGSGTMEVVDRGPLQGELLGEVGPDEMDPFRGDRLARGDAVSQ